MVRNNPATGLAQVLTADQLVEMAGDRYFARGETYFRRGYVHDLVAEANGLTARVRGTADYDVELWVEDGSLHANCTCPLGLDDLFCKHCVAVGLTWLANPDTAKRPSSQAQKGRLTAPKPITLQEIHHFLEQQQPATLVRWILDRANQDDSWKQQLMLKVASSRPQGLDLMTFHRALQKAITPRRLIEWGEVSSYAEGIGDVFHSIQDLLDEHPQAVSDRRFAEIALLETALNSVDDSSGEVGSILEDFLSLHLQSSELAQPDPIELAERLFHAEMNSEFGSFHRAVETYADILGDAGITRYGELAETLWEQLPSPSTKDGSRTRDESDYRRSKLQRILENLALASGDIEAVVAIKRRDLSSPRSYLAIAQLYQQHEQPDRALEWAESGFKAFASPDSTLRSFIIEAYQRCGRTAEAMELSWQAFRESVSPHSYRRLKAQAEQSNQWPAWRNKALDYIRQTVVPPQPDPVGPKKSTSASSSTRRAPAGSAMPANPVWNRTGIGPWGRDRSILVDIFLEEDETELAWQEAQAGGCSRPLWLKLAEQLQQTHPEAALPIYQQEIEPLIQQTNNTAYASAVSFLKKVHTLMLRLDRQAEFNHLVAHLRQTYKGKRNFVALLNQQTW